MLAPRPRVAAEEMLPRAYREPPRRDPSPQALAVALPHCTRCDPGYWEAASPSASTVRRPPPSRLLIVDPYRVRMFARLDLAKTDQLDARALPHPPP